MNKSDIHLDTPQTTYSYSERHRNTYKNSSHSPKHPQIHTLSHTRKHQISGSIPHQLNKFSYLIAIQRILRISFNVRSACTNFLMPSSIHVMFRVATMYITLVHCLPLFTCYEFPFPLHRINLSNKSKLIQA